MKKRRKGRIREFERGGMQKSSEAYRRERREQVQSQGQQTQLQTAAGTTPKKKKLKINQGRLILTVIVTILIAVVGMSVKNVFDLRAEQDALKEEKKVLLQEEQSLKEELKNVNDLDYIEEQARIQLRMIKPGEILYITDDASKEKQEDSGDRQQNGKEKD